jgi:hypothetical protein
MPILALSGGDRYVAAAYLVFLLLVLSYLAIMAVKLSRIEREVVAIAEAVERRDRAADEAAAQRPREPVA